MNSLKKHYIEGLADFIWRHDRQFFLRCAPGALTQFENPLKKFSDLPEKTQASFLEAAELAANLIAPPIVNEAEE